MIFLVVLSGRILSAKAILHSAVFTVESILWRHAISSGCQTAVSGISSEMIGTIPEFVVAVGSIDLVVGELDR